MCINYKSLLSVDQAFRKSFTCVKIDMTSETMENFLFFLPTMILHAPSSDYSKTFCIISSQSNHKN